MMKRLLDLLLLVLILPIAAPIIAITALAVALVLGFPIFFRQERGGYKGSRFMLWKFRSMTNERDACGELLPDADRLTGFGRFIRATSLDELPCMWNLLKGDIGLVGPRPFMSRYLPLYSAAQMRRHDARPGITGWAQVKGRNNLTWEEKFELDLWYVDHCSLWLDAKILVLTIWKVVARDDVSSEGHSTMPLFTGTPADALQKDIL
jgi:lipopolysaccharide/colanic/teichoic acid biosynthesis glycosyltransferase